MIIFKRIVFGVCGVLLCAPRAARADTITPVSAATACIRQTTQSFALSFNPATDDFCTAQVGRKYCDTDDDRNITIQWSALSSTQASATFSIVLAGDTNCGVTNSAGVITRQLISIPVTSLRSIMYPDPANSFGAITDFTAKKIVSAAYTDACTTPVERTVFVCAIIDPGNGSTAKQYAYLPIGVDTKPPSKVTDFSVAGLDGELNVTINTTADVDLQNIHVCAVARGAADTPETCPRPDGAQTVNGHAVIDRDFPVAGQPYAVRVPIDNGVDYDIVVWAKDKAGNEGEHSASVTARARDECDFWECYPGREQGRKTGFCFVSTAAYGSYDSPFVQVFRDFRDRVLVKFGAGRAFIVWYYEHGVDWGLWLARHAWARRVAAALLLVPYVAVYPVVRFGPGLMMLCVLALGLIAWLAPRAVAWTLTRRRARVLILAAACVLGARSAMAQQAEEPPPDTASARDTSSMWDAPASALPPTRPKYGINLRLGGYAPSFSTEPAAAAAYRQFFGPVRPIIGGSGRRVRVDLDLEWFFWRKIGLLGAGLSGGFWQVTGKSLFCGDTNICNPSDLAASSATAGKSSTQLTVFPFTVSLVYKFDFLLERFRVPLVPFVSAGLDAYVWRVDASGREARKLAADGTRRWAHNATFGWHVHPGLMINIDWIEPDAARRALDTMGIHGTFITAMWLVERIDSFGSQTAWDLSDSTFMIGLAMHL